MSRGLCERSFTIALLLAHASAMAQAPKSLWFTSSWRFSMPAGDGEALLAGREGGCASKLFYQRQLD